MKISRTKIEEGIKVSQEKSIRHLDAAEMLIYNDFLDNAVASIEFAIEEFGRAVYLRERLHLGLETIEKSLETDHSLKYNKAFSILPTELKTIWQGFTPFPKGTWHENYWPRGFWGGKKETISHSARLNAIFTRFDEKTQTWYSGINTDKRKLEDIVNKLKEYIRNFN